MNEMIALGKIARWEKVKALVLDSVSSQITRRVYNLGLDEFIAWYTEAPRSAGFTKATVTAWRVALEARGLGPISINVRITAVRKLAVEAADNGLLAPELASGRSGCASGTGCPSATRSNCLTPRTFARRRDCATGPCSPPH